MRHISTSNWEILKGERIPRWPSKIGEKRPIHVTINSWIGISAGAKHTYLKINEEENQWWCEDENAWVSIYCDSSATGYSLKADVMSESEAISIAKFAIKVIAGKDMKNHTVIWEGPGRPKWAKKY